MTKASDIFDYLCSFAPIELQMDFDNSGFLMGRKDRQVNKALLSLDITAQVADEAIDMDADIIISHHPLIFGTLKQITDDKILRLAENSVAVISMHTNLDIAKGGVNDVLLSLLGAEYCGVLDDDGCGRVGCLPNPVSMQSFLDKCRTALSGNGLRYYDSGRAVKKLAVMGGAGGEYVERAYLCGCDTYVTSDIKYHQFLQAAELGINLIDADHFCTENPVIPVLAEMLSARFPEVEFRVSEKHRQLINFA